jgi:hypothetical protein
VDFQKQNACASRLFLCYILDMAAPDRPAAGARTALMGIKQTTLLDARIDPMSDVPDSVVAPKTRSLAAKILATSAIYFGLVFAAGMVMGPARVLWLEPWLGPTLAVACELPLLIVAMSFAARWAPRWAGLEAGWLAHLGVGVLALIFQQLADLSVGFGLRGMSINDQLRYFSTPAGWLYAGSLAVFALTPLFAYWRRSRTKPAAIS